MKSEEPLPKTLYKERELGMRLFIFLSFCNSISLFCVNFARYFNYY